MKRHDHTPEPLLGRNLPPRSLGLCGPECRYRALYEGAQGSLSDMASRQASALGRHGRLRSGVIAALKGVLPRQFAELESRVASRLSDVDDEALLAYTSYLLENALAPGRTGAGSSVGGERLRIALEAAGFAVPAGDDLSGWADAVRQGGQRVDGPRVEAGPAALPVSSRLTRTVDESPSGLVHVPDASNPPVVAVEPDVEPLATTSTTASDGGQMAVVGEQPAPAAEHGARPDGHDAQAEQSVTSASPMPSSGGWMQATGSGAVASTTPQQDLALPVGVIDADPSHPAQPPSSGVPPWIAAAEANYPARRRTLSSIVADKSNQQAEPPTTPWQSDPVTHPVQEPGARTFEPATIEPAGARPETRTLGSGTPASSAATTAEIVDSEPAGLVPVTARAEPTPARLVPAALPAGPATSDNPWAAAPATTAAPAVKKTTRGAVVRPELFPTSPGAKAGRRKRTPKSASVKAETFGGPIEAAAGGVLNDEVRARLSALITVPRPVFDDDLVAAIGDPEIVQAWKDEMRAAGEIGFIPPKPRHRLRGSLVVPRGLLRGATDAFQKSMWADCITVHKGATLYELAVLFHRVAEQAKSGEIHGHGETVMLRLNQPRGVVGVVVVLGSTLGTGEATRLALIADVEELLAQPLELLVVLAAKDPGYEPMIAAVAEEALQRSWSPACNVVAARSWEYASGNTQALRQLLA